MKKVYNFLKLFVTTEFGSFIGYSIYKYWDYKKHPVIYEANSAPWYTSIIVAGICDAAITVVLLVVMLLLKGKIKKAETGKVGMQAIETE